jgi:opacity protein-like surface antigen
MRFALKSAAVALTFAMLQTAASAADLAAPYLPPQNDEYPVELGTGWYIRGDLAGAQDNSITFGAPNLQRTKVPNGWSAGLGAGYKFTNFLRADLTVDYRSPVQMNSSLVGSQPCLVGAAPVLDPTTGRTIGSSPIFDMCNALGTSRLNRTHVLANAYVDLGTYWSRFTPYVGAGVGVNVIYNKSQINWFMGNQLPYNIVFTDPFSNVTFHQFQDVTRSGYAYRLAWAAMAGVAVDLTTHLKLDVGYRYLGLGRYTGMNFSGAIVTKDLHAQEIRTGFRYVID